MNQSNIRNFAIIAHIDHGKSTLADRLMEMTGTVSRRDMQEQLLDSNPIERERGITIKLAPVRMIYRRMLNDKCQMPNEKQQFSIGHLALDIENSKQEFVLNLIDTPGHVDFTYEVSRSLAACEGALLVVDATQGVQAQTLANLHLARDHNLKIIPIINKIDVPNARIEDTQSELLELGFLKEEILHISAKTGKNVEQVLHAIVERIPSPQGDPEAPTRALVFSSQYDPHKGVVVFVLVVDGSLPFKGDTFKGQTLKDGMQIQFLASRAVITPIEVGYFSPKMIVSDGLETGEVGYIATGLKDVRMAKVGDTITICNTDRGMPNDKCQMTNGIVPLPGYKEPKPMVFVGLYPIEQDEFTKSRVAMEKLRLSDSAFSFRPISSQALGNGFHCGFLGLLHAEIVQERLSREFGLSLLATAPSVEYMIQLKENVRLPVLSSRLSVSSHPVFSQSELKTEQLKTDKHTSDNRKLKTDDWIRIQSPSEFPDPSLIEEVKEPVMRVTIYAPKRYIGPIMQLCQEKRGAYIDMKYIGIRDEALNRTGSGAGNMEMNYLIPLSDMIVDFFDALKSVTEGYASLDYEFFDYQKADVVKVDIVVNREKVDALSFLVVKDQARRKGKEIVGRLAEVLPRQQFSIPVQAAIGGDIVARADIKPYRKDVIAKLYGGDRTRKDKLLKKQKRGKERMKMIGNVEIPQDAFFTVLKKS